MFRTDVMARRYARIGSGATLLAGAGVLAVRSFQSWSIPAATIIAATWLGATITYWMLSRQRIDPRPHVPDAWLATSLVIPTLGLLAMLPLAIHLLVATLLGVGTRGFDDWATMSYAFTTPTTIVVGTLAAVRAVDLARGRIVSPALSSLAIYGFGVATSCIPFVVFVLPPALIAMTGLPFIAVFRAQARIVERERHDLARPWVPAAVALPGGVR